MPGVDPDLALHRLHVDPLFISTKQRKRTFIKEKNLAIIEEPLKIDGPKESQESAKIPEWVVYVDEPRNGKGVGVGIMIQGHQVKIEYTLRFSFNSTNNEAEYEAMVAGLMLVKILGIHRVLVRGNSKLVMD
ncbi:hypothetical protein LIER_26465 [Lithospermum erythrorhizon]|uniref:RNase H type-1 domain-containing protein n=1 Tax=Lithospermum erythrorhizon TaxID=34254 RepID=A0AAV3RBN8_LITER